MQNKVQLWWPAGYGEQPLYDLTVTWESRDRETSSKNVKIGFRTIELDQNFINPANESLGIEMLISILCVIPEFILVTF